MRKEFLGLTGVFLIGTSSLFAQPQPTTLPRITIETTEPGRGVPDLPVLDLPKRSDAAEGCRFWARSEYLLWWVKNTPLPVPIVTTGNPNIGFPLGNTAG